MDKHRLTLVEDGNFTCLHTPSGIRRCHFKWHLSELLQITPVCPCQPKCVVVAKLTGKRPDNVLRDFNLLIEQGAINALSFEGVEYTDRKGEKRPMYKLNFEATRKKAQQVSH